MTDHTFFMSDQGMSINHIDRNPYNNVVTNLCMVNTKLNAWNQTFKKMSSVGYKSVSKSSVGKHYKSGYIGKELGSFKMAGIAKAGRILDAQKH